MGESKAPPYNQRSRFLRGTEAWNRSIKILARCAWYAAAGGAYIESEALGTPLPPQFIPFAALVAERGYSWLSKRLQYANEGAPALLNRLESENSESNPS